MQKEEHSKRSKTNPESQPRNKLFKRGFDGLLLMFVAVNLLGIVGANVITSLLIGVAITMCAITFRLIREFYQFELSPNENSVLGITWILSIAFAWWLPLSELLHFTGLVWFHRYYGSHYGAAIYLTDPGPLLPHYTIIHTFGYIFIGVIFLLWAGVFISLRKHFHGKPLDIAAIICFFVAAFLILTLIPIYWVNGNTPWINSPQYFFQPFLGFLLLAIFVGPACILSAILFRRWDAEFASIGKTGKRHLTSVQHEVEITEGIHCFDTMVLKEIRMKRS